MPAERIRLVLGEPEIEDLCSLARHSGKLERVIAAAGKIEPQIGTAAVAKLIAKEVDIPSPELRGVIVALLNFYRTQLRLKVDANETAEAIGDNLRRLAKSDNDERLGLWESAKSKIVSAVGKLGPDHPLEAAFKAYRVATSRQYEFVGAKIFTEVRPVFNDAGNSVVQAIISHVLSIDYHDGPDHRVIQFTLDAADVSDLRDQAERAMQKGQILKNDLKFAPWPTRVFREPVDPSAQS